MEEVNSRLVRLERDLKICKFVIGLMGILIAALVGGEYVALRTSRTLGAAAVPKTIEAHEFVVLDDQNRPVALLGELFPTRPVLILSYGLKAMPPSSLPLTSKNAPEWFDLDSWPTLILSADDNEADMEMDNHKKQTFMRAGTGKSKADLTLSSGDSWAVVSAAQRGKFQKAGASFSLYRYVGGNTSAAPGEVPNELDLEANEDGETTFQMNGSGAIEKNRRMELDAPTNSNPSLQLFDNDGNLRASLGSTSLEVTRTGAEETTAPSSLTFFDKKGKVLWQAPR
jgi:hypothetical protein